MVGKISGSGWKFWAVGSWNKNYSTVVAKISGRVDGSSGLWDQRTKTTQQWQVKYQGEWMEVLGK